MFGDFSFGQPYLADGTPFSSASDVIVSLTGISAEGFPGNLTADTGISVVLDGVVSASAPGDLLETGDAIVSISGLSALGFSGILAEESSVSVVLTGVQATASPGTLTVNISVSPALDGIGASASTGTISEVTGTANIFLMGRAGTASPGAVSIPQSVSVHLGGVEAVGSPGVLFNNFIPDYACCEGPYRLLSIFEILIPPPPLNALLLTDYFPAPPTDFGSNDIGIQWNVLHRADADLNRCQLNKTSTLGVTELNFQYQSGFTGRGVSANAKMEYAVGAIHPLLEDSDQLSEGIVLDAPNPGGNSSRSGPSVFQTGTQNAHDLRNYFTNFDSNTSTMRITRADTADSITPLMATTPVSIGDMQTITVKNLGTSTRIRLFRNGAMVQEYIDASGDRCTGGALGFHGYFCGASAYAHWSPLRCAIPKP